MVKADDGPVERMSWRSVRGAGEDDDDRESVMLGHVPLVSHEGIQPIALEDPWWSKLTGFRSQRKAVVFAVFIMALGLYLIIAGTVQERLTRATQLSRRLMEVDTRHNSLRAWIDWMKIHRFKKPLSSEVQHVDQQMALECAAEGWSHKCTHKVFADAQRRRRLRGGGGLGPQVSETISYEGSRGRYPGVGLYGNELRLPVGVALAYHKDLFELEAHDCATGDIFHFECYTITSRNQKRMEALRRSLYRVILHIAEPGARLSGKRLELLHSLIQQAQRSGVTTEIQRGDMNAESAAALRGELERLAEGRANDSKFTDIMLYPQSSMILYRGSFLGLKFEGQGDLYHRRGNQIAYRGMWRGGRIHGQGTLMSEEGDVVWDGEFRDGVPVRPWWVV